MRISANDLRECVIIFQKITPPIGGSYEKAFIFSFIIIIILVACSADDTEQNSEKDAQIEKQDDIAQVEEKDKTKENVNNKELKEKYNPFFAIGNITLNKRDIVLHEVENGKFILVGEKLQNGSAKIAVSFTGNLQRVWKNTDLAKRFSLPS